jgi:hypothetical protein
MLITADIDEAIRLGETGQPGPYLLHNKQRDDQQRSTIRLPAAAERGLHDSAAG